MYSKNEIPKFSASLFYYDFQYSSEVSYTVKSILKEYGFFPPEKIYADRLTGNRYRLYSRLHEDVFVKAYSEPNIIGLSMASGDSRKVTEFWQFDWGYTFYKCSDIDISQTSFKPWNVITLQSTYGRLNEASNQQAFLNCVLSLIKYLKPFYGNLDDIDNLVELDQKPFQPNEKRPVFWGNYWGSDYCKMVGVERLNWNPEFKFLLINDGVFFALTDCLRDCTSRTSNELRRRIEEVLN